MPPETDTSVTTSEQIFDVNQVSPQFYIYLKNLIQTLISGITNAVNSIIAGTGISVSSATGNVTITNTGVTSNVAGAGIGLSSATGAVTVTNLGVTSLVAGTGISVSAATGTVTVSTSGAGVSYSSVTSTRNLSTASGSETIAHGLGKTPSCVRADANVATGNSVGHSRGFYNGTTQNYSWFGWKNTGTDGSSSQGTGSIIQIYDGGGTEGQVASITVDATNINVTWTKVGAGSASIGVLWEVEG